MRIKINSFFVIVFFLISQLIFAQQNGLNNTTKSNYAKLQSVDMGDVQWTKGFWADRMQVCKDSMVPHLWRTYTTDISHAYKNFLIAAGEDTGSHEGPSFHDGDFYKVIEAVASLYATTKDKHLDEMLDSVIVTIAKVQRTDGYIYTDALIAQRKTGQNLQFQDRLSFEAYNIGHLMTAGCVHFRATGKRTLLNVAIKATDYLYSFYKKSSPELARNAICPAHYMGVVEMYRTTGDPRYLELAKHLIDIKGDINDGTDDNQDRIPFRQQTKATGHAVRANYLYAGVADLYTETGDTGLLKTLDLMWNDVTNRKMYITGGCGALYDGVSPNAVSYKPSEIQQIHQAYGRDYQLPNMTAHNETCANVGNVLWNWRMLELSGESKYADVLEEALYNSVLSGISLNGNNFFYTNPLSASDALPYNMRWSGGRVPYIKLSNCCPPNVIRTITEVSDYAYSVSDKGLWLNLYGANHLITHLKDGSVLKASQVTNYPWDGAISFTMQQVPTRAFSVFMRIPGWCKNAVLLINNKPTSIKLISGEYAEINRNWKVGDKLDLKLPMPVTLIESNPLVEETRNQVAVKRGPIVYCLESTDFPKGTNVFEITMPAINNLKPVIKKVDIGEIASLEGTATIRNNTGWSNTLYKELNNNNKPIKVTLIPYFAWANRGHSEMTVWMPVK